MKVIIIEDEQPAIDKLVRYIHKYDPSIEILACLKNLDDAEAFLKERMDEIDLMFMDIQLERGLSFELFNRLEIKKPIVFITAYDEYAVDAFKVNSIDYILKPVSFTALSKAINKLKSFSGQLVEQSNVNLLIDQIKQKKLKERFMVKMGNHIHTIKTGDVSLFYAEGRTVFMVTNMNKKFIIEYKLEELSAMLRDETFFRVNRTFIININAIDDVIVYSNSRLKVCPKIPTTKEIVVSREKVSEFKEWLAGS